jgi:hypothetical protein
MKAALKTLSSIAKSQNTREKAIMRAHRDKNEQCLLSSRSALTTSSAYYIHKYCDDRVGNDPIASLVLIMLYSGRDCYEVIDNLELIFNREGQQELRLYTKWSMPKSESESNVNSGTCSSNNMYLVIPTRLKPAEKLRQYQNYKEKLESWVQDFLPVNKALPAERFTLSRIKLLLPHYCSFREISDYENAFISGKSLEQESHQSYGIIDRNLIQCKFDSFRQALETSNLSPQSVTFESVDFQAVGSNFASDTATVASYFERINSKAINLPILDSGDFVFALLALNKSSSGLILKSSSFSKYISLMWSQNSGVSSFESNLVWHEKQNSSRFPFDSVLLKQYFIK